MENNILDYAELKRYFLAPRNELRPVPFYLLDGDITDADEIASQLAGFKKSGWGGIALLACGETVPGIKSDAYLDAVEIILERAKKLGMKVVYCDDTANNGNNAINGSNSINSDNAIHGDTAINSDTSVYSEIAGPSGRAAELLAEAAPEALSKTLKMYEYYCDAGEPVHRKLRAGGITLSVVAYELDTHDILDLRDRHSGNYVDWNPPPGNWNILQFACEPEPSLGCVNYLSYDASRKFVDLTYKRFAGRFADYIGDVVEMTLFRDIQFAAPNRRMWDDCFNKVFIDEYGFDPAPYYPALFFDIGPKTGHMRAMFMRCRAKMLAEGFFRAVGDFTRSRGLTAAGCFAETKAVSAPWMFGDGMSCHKYAGAACAELRHAYGYGWNGLKIASSAAYNYDKAIVACEIFADYALLDRDTLYREAMNAFARGVNFLIPHTLTFSGEAKVPHELSHRSPVFRDVMPGFCDFAARAQTLLRGGRHVCDIALLYPIYSLSAQTALFEHTAAGFEYPTTPTNADYMNLINAVLNYCCRDLTVLHPEVLDSGCFADDGALYLCNDVNYERYRLLILPGASMMSLSNLRKIRDFYDGGGKIIAAGSALPSSAFEYGEENFCGERGAINDLSSREASMNLEAAEIIEHIFGVSPTGINSFKEYYHNTNGAGGESYFVLSSKTAADGTETIEPSLLDRIINELDVAYDVEINDPPRVTNSGVLNVFLPSFKAMNAHLGFKTGGVFNHIHKKFVGCDIFYFSNTTNSDYCGTISLRGKFAPEEWNPHTGRIRKPAYEYVTIKGEIYTSIEASVESAGSVFFVCRDARHSAN